LDNLKSIYFFSLFLRIGITKAKEEYDERAAITKKRDEEINMFHKTKEKEITTLIEKLKSGSLSDADFLVQISQLYIMWFEYG